MKRYPSASVRKMLNPRGTTLFMRTGRKVRMAIELPPTPMDVVYHGRNGMIEIKGAKTPEMVMTAEYNSDPHATSADHRFFVVKNGNLYAWPGGNVWEYGRVCWGGNHPPRDTVSAYTTFFGSPFNRDLVQLPSPTEAELQQVGGGRIHRRCHPSADGHRRFQDRHLEQALHGAALAVDIVRARYTNDRIARIRDWVYNRRQALIDKISDGDAMAYTSVAEERAWERDRRRLAERNVALTHINNQLYEIEILLAERNHPMQLNREVIGYLDTVVHSSSRPSARTWTKVLAGMAEGLYGGCSTYRHRLFSILARGKTSGRRMMRAMAPGVKPLDIIMACYARAIPARSTYDDPRVRVWETWKIKQLWTEGKWADAARGRENSLKWATRAKPMPDFVEWTWNGHLACADTIDRALGSMDNDEELKPLLTLIAERWYAKPKWAAVVADYRAHLEQHKGGDYVGRCRYCGHDEVRPNGVRDGGLVYTCPACQMGVTVPYAPRLPRGPSANVFILGWRKGDKHFAFSDNALYQGTEQTDGAITWERVKLKSKRSRAKKHMKEATT